MTNLVEKKDLEKVLQEKFPELKITIMDRTIFYDAYAAEGTVDELQAFLNLVKFDNLKLERRVF